MGNKNKPPKKPTKEFSLEQIAESCMYRAGKEREKGHFREALALCQQGIDAFKQALGEAKADTEVLKKIQDALADAYCDEGKILEGMENFEGAITSYRLALKLRKSAKSIQNKIDELSKKTKPARKKTDDKSASPVSDIGSDPIFQKNPEPSTELNLDPKAVIQDTRHLAHVLIHLKPEEKDYQRLKRLALEVISEFKQRRINSRSHIREVTALASIGDKEISKALLDSFIELIQGGATLDFEVLDGLACVIKDTTPDLLDVDKLVKLVEIVQEREKELFRKGPEKYHHIVLALSRLFDAMVAAEVKGLDRVKLHVPLCTMLADLAKSPDRRLAYQAAYALQGLLRIPHNESRWKAVLRRTLIFGKGVANIINAFKNISISNLEEAIKNFRDFVNSVQEIGGEIGKIDFEKAKLGYEAIKEAKTGEVGKLDIWYEELNFAELLLQVNQFVAFEEFIKNTKSRNKEVFVLGIIQRLENVICTHYDKAMRQNALLLLGHMAQTVWRNHQNAVTEVFQLLKHYSQSSEPELNQTAIQVLARLKDIKDFSLLEGKDPSRGAVVYSAELGPFPTELLTAVSKIDGGPLPPSHLKETIGIKLQQLCGRILADEDIKKELAIYISPDGKKGEFDDDAKNFDLEGKEGVGKFLNSERRVLLLLGSTGTGKTTFCRHLEHGFWEGYQEDRVIPLFISLASVKDPESQLLERHLADLGEGLRFTPEEIDLLRQQYKFVVFLDGYDEIKKFTNVIANNIKDWPGAKVIITCRQDYLRLAGPGYERYFKPKATGKQLADLFMELYVAPFSPEQVTKYIARHLELHPETPWSIETYKDYIGIEDKTDKHKDKKIDGIDTLVKTPMLLMMTAEVLPRVVQKHAKEIEEKRRIELTKAELCDEYSNYWFEREADKVGDENDLPIDGHEIVDDFWVFAMQLAYLISYAVEKKKIQTERIDPLQEPWAGFFKGREEDKDIFHARKACLAKFHQKGKYGFLHNIFLDYFATEISHNERMKVVKNKTKSILHRLPQTRDIDEIVFTPLPTDEVKSEDKELKSPENSSFQEGFLDQLMLLKAIQNSQYGGFSYSSDNPRKWVGAFKGAEIEFEEFEAKADGFCGFYAIGVSPAEVVSTLAGQSSKEEVRKVLALEIAQEVKRDILEGTDDRWREVGLSTDLINDCKKPHDPSDLQAAEQEEKIQRNLIHFCEEEKVYQKYVQGLHNGWLGCKSARLVAQYYQKPFNLYIWRKDTKSPLPNALILDDSYVSEGVEDVRHLFYTNSYTHFNLLVQADWNKKIGARPEKLDKVASVSSTAPSPQAFPAGIAAALAQSSPLISSGPVPTVHSEVKGLPKGEAPAKKMSLTS